MEAKQRIVLIVFLIDEVTQLNYYSNLHHYWTKFQVVFWKMILIIV